MSKGLTNFNYKLHGDPDRFLKIYRYPDREKVEVEIDLLKQLGMKASLFSHKEKLGIITEFIDGDEPEQNEKNIYKIGKTLGNFHKVKNPNLIVKNPKEDFEKLQEEIFSLDLKEFQDLIKLCQQIPFNDLPKSTIHGDVFLDNLLAKEGEIYLIDYEEVCVNNSLYDIGRGVIGCCIKSKEINRDLVKSLIKGYEEIREIEEVEKEFLDLYIVYLGIYSAFWRYKEFNITRKDPDQKELYLDILNPVLQFSNNLPT
ncbi:MAG: phosphotransferase [Campylobacterales bacterium]|nr:phosphotransferase [Campylobacterales bacterium]